MTRASQRGVLGLAILGFVAVSGCVTSTGLLDEGFLNALSGQQQVASLPGSAPVILLGLENQSGLLAEIQVSYRTGADEVEIFTASVQSGQRTAQALACPIKELTVGDLNDLSQSGVVIRLGNGTNADPIVIVEPFGTILKQGANFDCGDGVTFTVLPSDDTLSGYRVYAFVNRAD